SGEASLRALLAGRADYWASGNYSGPRMLRDAGATDRVRLLFTFERTELYLACNPGVADELVDRLRAAQKQLEGDGTFQRIDAKYAQ
ncbi:MAG: ABC transporter substrate-binding protein, partial [Burkholderiales bacterium]|nr:ABC transporter substrate-binding protein [Burkholderiales bacterium]